MVRLICLISFAFLVGAQVVPTFVDPVDNPESAEIIDAVRNRLNVTQNLLPGYQEWMHSFSRPLGPPVGNTIFQSTEAEVYDYGIALGITVAIIAAIGLALCIFGGCMHCMDWCGKDCGRLEPEGKEDNLIIKWWPACLVITSTLAIIVLVIIIIVSNKSLESGKDTMLEALLESATEEALRIRSIGQNFALMSPAFKAELTTPDGTAAIFSADDNSNGIADSWRNPDLIGGGAWDVQGPDIWDKANQTNTLLTGSNTGRVIYFWITIAVVLAVLLVGLIGAIAKFAPPPRIAGCMAFVAILFLWVLMAVHLSLAVAGSDMCDDSNELIRVFNCAVNPANPDFQCEVDDLTLVDIIDGMPTTKESAGLLVCNSASPAVMDYYLEFLRNSTNAFPQQFAITNPQYYDLLNVSSATIRYSTACLWLSTIAIDLNEPICNDVTGGAWRIFLASLLAFLFFLPFSFGSIVIWKRRLDNGSIVVVMNNEAPGSRSGTSEEEIVEEYEMTGGYGGATPGGQPAVGVPVDGSYSGSYSATGSGSGSQSQSAPSGSGSGSYSGSYSAAS